MTGNRNRQPILWKETSDVKMISSTGCLMPTQFFIILLRHEKIDFHKERVVVIPTGSRGGAPENF